MLPHVTFGRKASYLCFFLGTVVLMLAALLYFYLSLGQPALICCLNGMATLIGGSFFRIYDAELRVEQEQATVADLRTRLDLYRKIAR